MAANRVGATVNSLVYTSPTRIAAAQTYDSYISRLAAQATEKWYFTEGQWPADANNPQPVADLWGLGSRPLISFKPWRDSTGNYTPSAATPGGNTYAQEKANLAAAVAVFQAVSNAAYGPLKNNWHAILFNEASLKGKGYFATAALYQKYVTFYGPAIRSAGVPLIYNPVVDGGGQDTGFCPAGIDGIWADYYGSDWNSGHLIGPLVSLANTLGLPLGIGEMGSTASSALPAEKVSEFLTYLLGVFIGQVNSGLPIGDILWWDGTSAAQNLNTITGPGDFRAAYLRAFYDDLVTPGDKGMALPGMAGPGLWQPGDPGTTSLPAPPPIVIPSVAIPGRAVPGSFTPADPGGQSLPPPIAAAPTAAIPGQAQPGSFTPGYPGTQSLPAPGMFAPTPAIPGAAQPGSFTPGYPGTGALPPPGPGIVQEVHGTAAYNYGWAATEFDGNVPGNMLVVIAGWDVNAVATTAPMPAVYVTDSALNYWYHAGTTTATNTGARCAIWVAPNARPVQWVACSPTTFTSSLAYTILEVSGAPAFFALEGQALTASLGTAALAASPGATGQAGMGFSVLAAGSTGVSLPAPPPGWAALNPVTAGAGQPNGVTIFPAWASSVPAGTNLQASYTLSAPAPAAAATAVLTANPPAPVQPSPNLPRIKVEAAFGFLPGDPTQSPPAWTDITSRCTARNGMPYLQPVMGKGYELATPETGELAISCDNHDGALTPGNVNSPYAPGTGVTLGTPVRVSAYWDGSWYNLAFGYIERWPQEWPDVPQWGMSAMIAADAFSALAAAVSYSALNGDMLLDGPAVLIPCNEQYTTQANSLNTVTVASECQGLLAANIARGNQRPGTYVDGTGAPCATGQSTTLLGSQDTGFGCSSFTAPLTPTSSGPGMVYWDPALPSPLAPAGLTAEFWLTITAASATANVQPTVFTAFSAPSNYQTANPSLQVQVQNFTGNNILQVTFANGTTMTAPFSPSPNPQQVALVFSPSTVSLFVNGALAQSQALSAAQAGNWAAVMLGGGNYAYHNGTLTGGVFTAMSLGIYPYQLPLQRIASHYVTGVSGQAGADATTRIAQVLAWSALGIPRAGQVTFGGVAAPVLQGPAYSLSGANVSTAVNQAAANEAGMAFTTPDGTLQFKHRWALFNQAPAAAFGDDEDAGEIPFLPGQAFDFDNSFLYNTVKVQQAQGPTTGITVTSADTGSQAAYFGRSILQVGIQTASSLDAYDLANQSVSFYSQPSLRVRGLTVDAAANPQGAFPGVLSLQQGNAAVVNRRPVGGAPISANVIVQKVSHSIGPDLWQTSYEMSPYPPLDAVLQLDNSPYNIIGTNSLP